LQLQTQRVVRYRHHKKLTNYCQLLINLEFFQCPLGVASYRNTGCKTFT